jgi:diguanylate cyclase (GGDEF)-like protein
MLCHEPQALAARIATADPCADSTGELSLLQRELGRARQKIATLDRVDPATGLVRFAYFQETLRRDLAMARRDRRFVTLLIFEIVEFDTYRLTFGDKAADSCQRMIGAQIMRALRRAGDLCARYDDGILVAAVIGQHASEVQPIVDRIDESVRQLKLHNPRAKSSRYIGTRVAVIGCPPGAHDDPEPLIARALTESRSDDGGVRALLA